MPRLIGKVRESFALGSGPCMALRRKHRAFPTTTARPGNGERDFSHEAFMYMVDHESWSRELENRLNAVLRRGKIRNVREKRAPAPVLNPFRDIMSPQPVIPGTFTLPTMTAPKCGCKPGTVCGNVACPHLPVVTC